MFEDARQIEDGAEVRTDVCIVGAGAAGITLAREFLGQGFRVCLLEAGGLTRDSAEPSLYRGENVGTLYYPLSACRLRYFGGTTNHWGGACWPLERIDFEQRPGVPHSGWPIARDDLDPYYGRASEICQIGPDDYRPEFWSRPETPLLPLQSDRVCTKLYQDSPPTRFGEVYREELRKSENVRVLLQANVTEIEAEPEARRIRSVRVACRSGSHFTVSAQLYVLAAGALENARLLLLSNRQQPEGLGNAHDLVGRFFQEHPMLPVATLALRHPTNLKFFVRHRVGERWIRAGFGLTEATLRSEQLLNVWWGLLLPGNVPIKPQALRSWNYLKRSIRRGEIPEDFARHIMVVMRNLDDVFDSDSSPREAEGGSDDDVWGTVGLLAHAEQSPNESSRVTLADERDDLGLRRIRLDWRLSEIDRRSLRRAVAIFGAELGRAGIGRLQFLLDDDDASWLDVARASEDGGPRGSFHQMGTTRMHASASEGVVDANCRVHGIENFYVAGSSVFTTCGYANPTLTIVALTLRLADHLKVRLRAEV